MRGEPVRGRTPEPGFYSLSGLEQSRAWIKGLAARGPGSYLTGMLLTQVGAGNASGSMPASPWVQNFDGTVEFRLLMEAILLERVLSPPHFPITPAQLRGKWTFERMEPGSHQIEGLTVLAREIPHKGGLTLGYRVADGTATVAYLSDHAPQMLGDGPDGVGAYHEDALALARDVDLLIHDAQYTAEELPERGGYGHAAAEYAVGLARATGARRVALFHHDPARTDDEVDAILARSGDAGVPVVAAAEGLVVDL